MSYEKGVVKLSYRFERKPGTILEFFMWCHVGVFIGIRNFGIRIPNPKFGHFGTKTSGIGISGSESRNSGKTSERERNWPRKFRNSELPKFSWLSACLHILIGMPIAIGMFLQRWTTLPCATQHPPSGPARIGNTITHHTLLHQKHNTRSR